ncbi:uncharacterized protein Z520_00772 [Fonsecaea multimorphosa CBS 102226]|uniref:AB hydrolase-1 domain-containing protein n=1 Tax=Fonsecaea multimorphosa CBS 102226 TaxID=1442371 RepID=A0A0D2KKR0_9EURO|nr:uncharacterized protein Z520_00772 [Fonsecaea multimorphosa CBS 102226]KIY04080.1 hypothetical protein Z520_00772 [Fonsecaea multimorphosa CBS 102226]OAL31914.1 hypothetical protein AYO22_00784 [Fonsecaea multimorphosa]
MPTYSVSRGFAYNYIHIAPRDSSKKYVLFLHGWPSIAHEWHHQIDHFHKLGYGVVAPDLLGSGLTARPLLVKHYLLKDMAGDVVEILDHENISSTVFAVGHDWGSHLLGRLAVYHPERLERICFIAVGYRPPRQKIDIDAVNAMTQQKLGYSTFGYQIFFTKDENAMEIMNQHKDSVMSLLYADDPTTWKVHLGPPGALQKWAEAGSTTPYGSYLTEEDHKARNANISEVLGGLPSLNWYKAHAFNHNYEAEKGIPDDKTKLTQPTLYLTCQHDYIGVWSLQLAAMEAYVPDLQVQHLNTGHWGQLQAAEEVNLALENFFSRSS